MPVVRRLLVQVHLWVGVASGLYIFVVCLTGAALVFRIDLQRARHPELFTPRASGVLADPVKVMERVSQAYPEHRLSGVEAPTSRRPTYLAYVTRGREFVTVLIDPVSAEIFGELPSDPLVSSIQRLHFDLMGGRTGRTLNGVGAACILVMCLTGCVIWWPGRRRWFRAFLVDVRRDWRRMIWELHRAIGIWTVIALATFALTGLSLVFPAQFRTAVNAISPITVTRAPVSLAAAPDARQLAWAAQIAQARQARPGEHIARVVTPTNERAAFLVLFSRTSPTPAGSELSSVYLDQYSGNLLTTTPTTQTAGDRVMAWTIPLHVGGFGGNAVRWLWFALGLAPPLLFVTGMTMWWSRSGSHREIREIREEGSLGDGRA